MIAEIQVIVVSRLRGDLFGGLCQRRGCLNTYHDVQAATCGLLPKTVVDE